ncbi:ArnT family glycosyltransferase [Neobacillus sp. SM06]|uniref:ArnT family glycosyltransferase n=1 Tax=Neobacillus sp. SM06 TaxID=3422492 RepID=UPI003D2AC9E4
MKQSFIQSKVYFCILVFLVFGLVSFNIFFKLGDFPIYSWDEARHGINAYEMVKHNNLFINTYRNQVDYWNLKPPLSFWAIIAGYKIAGFNPFGLRLLPAIFAFLTIIIVAAFAWATFGKRAGLISSIVLATCSQWLLNHGARTADADSLFVFLFTASILSLLLSIEQKKWLIVSAFSFSCAFLTKSWHAGSILLIILTFLFLTGHYKKIAPTEWFLSILTVVVPIVTWALFRYQYDQLLFFKKMIAYDLLHRSSTPIEGHSENFFYYVTILWKFSKLWIVLLLLFGFTMIHEFRGSLWKVETKSATIGIYLWMVIPFLLYTFASTKVRWYIQPVYPAISLAIGSLASKASHVKPVIIRYILTFSIVFTAIVYEAQIFMYIRNPIPKLQLSLLKNLERNKDLKGYSLYGYHHGKRAVWQQNQVLAAELYGDLVIQDGGWRTFLQKDHALLLIKRGKKTQEFILNHQLAVVYANEWGFIVQKHKSQP